MSPSAPDHRLAGYAFLIDKYQANVIPNWHTSSVSPTCTHHSTIHGGSIESVYPSSYWPGDEDGDHLEFALKYDGVNLGILSALFEVIAEADILEYIAAKPTGKYGRRIWFLYEFLTGRELALGNLTRGNYVDLLEPDFYYTASPGRRAKRHRIIDNLLGGRFFVQSSDVRKRFSRWKTSICKNAVWKGMNLAALAASIKKRRGGQPVSSSRSLPPSPQFLKNRKQLL